MAMWANGPDTFMLITDDRNGVTDGDEEQAWWEADATQPAQHSKSAIARSLANMHTAGALMDRRDFLPTISGPR
jgi:hypothetical protein